MKTKSIVKNKFTSILHTYTHPHVHKIYLLNAFNFMLNLNKQKNEKEKLVDAKHYLV